MSETPQPEGVAVERVVMRLRELSRARWDRDAWERETTVRIPAEPERDIDLVLSKAADLIEQYQRFEMFFIGEGAWQRFVALESEVFQPAHARSDDYSRIITELRRRAKEQAHNTHSPTVPSD